MRRNECAVIGIGAGARLHRTLRFALGLLALLQRVHRLLVGRDFLARCPLSRALGFSTRPGFLRNSFLRRAASQGFFLQPPLSVEPRCSHSLRRNFRFFPARCLRHRFSLCCRALSCRPAWPFPPLRAPPRAVRAPAQSPLAPPGHAPVPAPMLPAPCTHVPMPP